MQYLGAIFETASQELRSLRNRPADIFMLAIMPIVWCALIIGLFGEGLMRDLPVGMVNLDHSVESIELESKIDAIASTRLVSYASTHEAQNALLEGKIYAYIQIDREWQSQKGTPQARAIELYFPKSLYAIATSLELDIKQALLAIQIEEAQALVRQAGLTSDQAEKLTHTVSVNTVTVGNMAFNFQAYILPTLIPGILHLALVIAVCTRLITLWRERQVKEWLDSAKGNIICAYLGKVLPWWVVFTFYGLIYIALVTGYYGWSIQGSALLWMFGIGFFFFVMTLFPLPLIAIFIKLDWVFVLSCAVGYMAPIFPYIGFSYPLESMAKWVQWLAQLFPLTHYFAFQGEQWILNSHWETSLLTLSKLALFGIFWAATGYALFCRRVKEAYDEETNHA
ncbi:MAG TPA: ABC transporter permease [Candidatus Aphodousia faecipullorum]|nr:ABC transporter permease [Candidatus Aphodousia faecipullorum]